VCRREGRGGSTIVGREATRGVVMASVSLHQPTRRRTKQQAWREQRSSAYGWWLGPGGIWVPTPKLGALIGISLKLIFCFGVCTKLRCQVYNYY
jgi:hypothetical protein